VMQALRLPSAVTKAMSRENPRQSASEI